MKIEKKTDSLHKKNENEYKTICLNNIRQKKLNQKNSTSKDFTGNKMYEGSQTENCNFTNTKNFKLNTISDMYSNTELAGNLNSNFTWKNNNFSKENSCGDTFEKVDNLNFTDKINISTLGDQEMKIDYNEEDFDDKGKNWKNYINFNSEENMRKSAGRYNENDCEMKNKETSPKYTENDCDDYAMDEECKQIGNTEPTEIKKIKNINIPEKKNQKKKKGQNDSDEENSNLYPSQSTKNFHKINVGNIKNNINSNVTNNISTINNNYTRNPPLARIDNIPVQSDFIDINIGKNNHKENTNNTVNTNIHNDDTNKENFYEYTQEENSAFTPNENLNTNTCNVPAAPLELHVVNTVNSNTYQENFYKNISSLANQENYCPNQEEQIIENQINSSNNPIFTNPNPNTQTNENQENNCNNEANSSSKYTPILAKYEKQIPLEYIPEIWKSLKVSELSSASKPKYDLISTQNDISFDMRAILIDWIIEVHKNYRLFPETLYISIQLIDRYLAKKNISRTKLQLLGTTALFIASKYEEIVYPCLNEFAKITDRAYEKEDILEMEKDILNELDYDITHPSPFRFFEIISLNYNFAEVEFFYGCFLMESFLISSNYTKYYPSIIALAVVLLILRLKRYENYRDLYNLTDPENQRLIKECAKEIYEFPQKCINYNLNSVMNKYSSQTYHCVAIYQLENPVIDVNNNN